MTTEISADAWADRFAALRGGGPGAPSAWIGLPVAISALLGILWAIPVPGALAAASPALNFAVLFVLATFVYYCILSLNLAIGGLLFLAAATIPSLWLERHGVPVLPVSIALLIPALAWQLTETKRATGRLQIIANLQYLMLGPVWLLRSLYRLTGIPY